MRLLRYLAGFLDGTRSSTRLSGLVTVVSANVFAFVHPESTASLAALLGGAAAFLGVRNLGTLKSSTGAAPVEPSGNPDSKP